MSAKKMNVCWCLGYWGCAFVETDVPNNIEGGYCWAWAKIRPRWYWWLQRMRLFSGLVWRRYESDRIDWRLAWDVSGIARGLSIQKEEP